MRTRLGRAFLLERWERIERVGGVEVVEGNHAVGRALAKAADIADREDFDGDLHGEVVMIAGSDPAAHDQRVRPDPAQCGDRLGTPPEQRQRHGDQPGAQHAEQREHALDRVGDLDANQHVAAQPHPPQPAGDGRDHAVGLRVGQAARLAVGEALAIRRIDQRDGVGAPQRRPVQQFVEGRARADTGAGRSTTRLGEDHGEGLALCFVASCRHQVSHKYP